MNERYRKVTENLLDVTYNMAKASSAISDMSDAFEQDDLRTAAACYKEARQALYTAHVILISSVDMRMRQLGAIR